MVSYPTVTVQVTYLYVGDEANPIYTDGKVKTDIYDAVFNPDKAAEMARNNPKLKIGTANLAILKTMIVAYIEVLGATKVELAEEERVKAEIVLFERLLNKKYRGYHLASLRHELDKRK